MQALVIGDDKSLTVKTVPVPIPTEGEVLIRVRAAAQNPIDWMHVAYDLAGPGDVVGCDVAGVVEQFGPGAELALPGIKIGDRVAAFVHGGLFPGEGAYAQHARVAADLVIRIPDSLDFEAASTLPLAVHTAALGLRALGLPFLRPPAPPVPTTVLVWAASTSTGQFAVQLAKLAGLRVVATASPRNHAWIRTLGADAVVDYRGDAPAAVRAAARALGATELKYAYDGISVASSAAAIEKCFYSSAAKEDGPGTIVYLNGNVSTRPDVTVKNLSVYTIFGRAFSWPSFKLDLPAVPEDKKHAATVCRDLEVLLKDGKVLPNPVKVMPGGLAGVPDGFAFMQEGKVEGVKLVYVVD